MIIERVIGMERELRRILLQSGLLLFIYFYSEHIGIRRKLNTILYFFTQLKLVLLN